MAKAIHWPAQFRQDVIEEPTDRLYCAVRLGRLYYDNQYWVDGEEVDIRVNHKIIRKAVVVGDLKCCPIDGLETEDYERQKNGLKTQDGLIQFLAQTYNQLVTPQTEVTVVYYQNKPIDPNLMELEDDPHMSA